MSDATGPGASTDRLYYTDAYARTFEATLHSRAEGGRRIYLNRTAFYPTSGGQPHDLGMLGGVAVVDVVDEGDRIAHILAEPPEQGDGETVTCEIDWARRFDHMQQHTGQHVLSAVFAERFGHRTVSVHFGEEASTLDLDIATVDRETLVRAEAYANAIVFANLPVTVSFEEAADASALRKEVDREGTLRIVTIEDVDRSACGGTHVRRTGEIGAILLRKLDRVRGSARIEFLCGLRAVQRVRTDFEALSGIAASLSASLDDVAARVAATAEQLRDAERARKRLAEELSVHRARALYEAASPDRNGVRWIAREVANEAFDEAKAIAHVVTEMERVVYIVTVQQPGRVLLATSADSGVDAGATLKPLLGEVGGRGGGSARLAQGSVPASASVEVIRARLVDLGG